MESTFDEFACFVKAGEGTLWCQIDTSVGVSYLVPATYSAQGSSRGLLLEFNVNATLRKEGSSAWLRTLPANMPFKFIDIPFDINVVRLEHSPYHIIVGQVSYLFFRMDPLPL